jgi:mannose-6-phosphate isomerase-like protein (cupin superfamily)
LVSYGVVRDKVDEFVFNLVADKCYKKIMKYTYTLLFIITLNNSFGQTAESKEKKIKPSHETSVKKLSEDSLHSTFLIKIPNKVPLHFHQWHTENIVVVQGKAIMKLGSDTLMIKKGDQVTILKGTPHEVIQVISKKPLIVYSIQSPKFDPADRYFVEPR